jgi:hypothetical protein
MFLNDIAFTDTRKQESEIRKTSTKPEGIQSTYVWVYSGDPESRGDVEEVFGSRSGDDAAFIKKQSITLRAAKHRHGWQER